MEVKAERGWEERWKEAGMGWGVTEQWKPEAATD